MAHRVPDQTQSAGHTAAFKVEIGILLTSLRSGSSLAKKHEQLGRQFIAGFAQASNESAGNIVRKLLESLQTECGDNISGALFDCTKRQVLSMSDVDIGRTVKQRLRGMTRQRAGIIFEQLLVKCAEVPELN